MKIGQKLVSGFCIVLFLMVVMGAATYMTISNIRDKADKIKDYTNRLSLVYELQQRVSPWLVTNDFLITGAFQLEEFFEALSGSLYNRIKYMETLALSDEEKNIIREIREKFILIKDHSYEILRLVDSSGPSTSEKKVDLIISLRYVVEQIEEIYEHIITGNNEEAVSYKVMCKTIDGLVKEISKYPHGINTKSLLGKIKAQFSITKNNVQALLSLNLQDPLEDYEANVLISQIDITSAMMRGNIKQLLEHMKSEIGPVATMINVIRDPRTIALTIETDYAAETLVEKVEKLSTISNNYLNLAIAEADTDKRLGSIITIIMCSLAVLIGLGVAFVISRGITQPITSLVAAAGDIANGNLKGIEGIKSKDEIGELADSFNKMTINLTKSRNSLKQSEERYRDLVENSTEMIYQTDKERSFVGTNRTMLKKLDFQLEELKALRVDDIVPVDERVKIREHADKVIKNGSDSVETVFLTKQKETVYVEINAMAMYNSNNDYVQTRAFVRNITERKKAEITEQHKKNLRLLSSQIISVQEEERKRISRELHDEVGQALTAMKINIEMMELEVPEDSPKTKQRLNETKQLLTHTLNEIRSLSFELRPSLLDHFGVLAAIRGYSKNFSERTNINVEVGGERIVERFSPDIEILFYRCAQEALTNIAKHSKAKNVTIDIVQEDLELHMKIKDNGKGFDANKHFEKNMSDTSMGLFGMRERVGLVGGKLKVHSEKNKGTELEISAPFKFNAIENKFSEVKEYV